MNQSTESRSAFPPAPVHPLSALVTVLLDNIFGIIEIVDPIVILVTSSMVFIVCSFTTAFVQRFLSNERWGTAITKGLVMGVIAGVPFPVTGNLVGLPLLAWSALHSLLKLPRPKPRPASEDVVDAEFREL